MFPNVEVPPSRPASSSASTSPPSSQYYSVGSTAAGSISGSISSEPTTQWYDSKDVPAVTEEQTAGEQPLPWLKVPVGEMDSALSKLEKTLDEIYVVAKDLATRRDEEEEDDYSASAYSCHEDDVAATDTLDPFVSEFMLTFNVNPSLMERVAILQNFLLDIFIFTYSIPSSSLSPVAKQSQYKFFQSPYGGPCLMKSFEREKALYLSHIVMKPTLDHHEAHVVQEYVVEPCEKLRIPMECVIEQLQNYFWHQCTPINRHKSFPHQLATLCRDDVLMRKTRRLTLAGRLATDEYMTLRVTNTGDMQAVISRKIRSYGIDTLGAGWTEEFAHILGSTWVGCESRNFKVELEVTLAGEREPTEYAVLNDGLGNITEKHHNAKLERGTAREERNCVKDEGKAGRLSAQRCPTFTTDGDKGKPNNTQA